MKKNYLVVQLLYYLFYSHSLIGYGTLHSVVEPMRIPCMATNEAFSSQSPINAAAKPTGFFEDWQGANPLPFLGTMLIGGLFFIVPTPEGLSVEAWHLFGIFIATIVGIILKPLPMGAVAIFAMTAAAATNTISLNASLSSFSSPTVWLIVSAFLLARGFIKTGLGSRMAYYFMQLMGKSTLGLAYGLITTEMLLAPFIPSNTARGGGIIFPIATALSEHYDSHPDEKSRRKIGAYLIKTCFQTNVLTSAMFLTAMAGNPIIVSILSAQGIEMSWLLWTKAAIVPGILTLLALPILLRWLLPPELKETPQAPAFAKEQLKKLGKLSSHEKIMLGTFCLLLILWIFGKDIGMNATTAAFIGLGILLFTGVLNWQDVLTQKNAWDTFIWLSVILMLSQELTTLGMMDFIALQLQGPVKLFSWPFALGIVTLVYFYAHYLFGSMVALISSLYGALFMVAVAAGAPPMLSALLLAFGTSLSAGITHFSTGSAPVYFEAKYVTLKEWWKVGGLLSVFYLALWSTVGVAWWKMIGLW